MRPHRLSVEQEQLQPSVEGASARGFHGFRACACLACTAQTTHTRRSYTPRTATRLLLAHIDASLSTTCIALPPRTTSIAIPNRSNRAAMRRMSSHKRRAHRVAAPASKNARARASTTCSSSSCVKLAPHHPRGNPGASLQSISHRCQLREVAFEWGLTKETIYLPQGCFQGGVRFRAKREQLEKL